MEYLYISKFTEEEFDELILNAGGHRYTDIIQVNEGELNCDYILDDAVIELKIIEEEPIGKDEKQAKLAKLFRSDYKTVILNPLDLDRKGQSDYYKALETPIKNQLKKASKQLSFSAEKTNATIKIAVIINNGLTMTSPEEFKEIAIRRARNDTSGIDLLIIGGIYYYSDSFDGVVNTPFEPVLIRGKDNHEIFDKLLHAWNVIIEQYMTKQLVDIQMKRSKGPVQDLYFEKNGIRYVKPPVQWSKKSSFWGKNGRLRTDSTGLNTCPRITTLLPEFDEESYEYALNNQVDSYLLKSSLKEYLLWVEEERLSCDDPFHPIVKIPVTFNELKDLPPRFLFKDIGNIMNPLLTRYILKLEARAKEFNDNRLSMNYILVEVNEIGIDKANDVAFISYNRDGFIQEKQDFIITGERMKFEYAMFLACAHCLSLGADTVYYIRNEDFKWK